MTRLMEGKWEGEINGETEQKRQREKKKEQGLNGVREGHFSTSPTVNDKSCKIQLRRTNTRHHSMMFVELYLKSYPYSLILTTLNRETVKHRSKFDNNSLVYIIK